MPTTTIAASTLRYHDGSWHTGSARQGVYGSTNYRGEMVFSFSAQLDVPNVDISQIVLSVTAGALGGAYNKYLYLKTGGWDGDAVDDFQMASFFDVTRTRTLSADSNPTAFARLKAFIEGGGTTLGLYAATSRGRGSDKSYDYDYCAVTAMSLEITYTVKKSTGTVGSANTGSAATLAISAGSSSYSHKVTWKLGGHSAVQNVAAGVASASYTIPHSWLPNAERGTASVTLETLDGNTSLGSNTYRFAVSVPASVKPGISSVGVTPVNSGASSAAFGWGLYIQNKTKAAVSVTGASAGSGATIRSYAITSSPNVGSASSASYTTGKLTKAGSVTFTATVTDSRGRTATATATIAVQAYTAPKLTATPTIFRCTGNGTRDDTGGTYAKVKASFSCSSVNGNNSLTIRKVTLNGADTTLTSGTAAVIGGGNLAVDTPYTAVITLKDAVGGTTAYSLAIPSAAYLIHFKKGGRSMGIGRAAGTSDDRKIHVGWDVEVDAGHPVKVKGNGATASAFIAESTDGTKKCSLAVGSSGVRRGLYDITNDEWIIFSETDDVSRIERPLEVTDEGSFKNLNVGNASGFMPSVRFRKENGVPLGAVQASPSAHRVLLVQYPSDYNADTHAYIERYWLPAPDTGLSDTQGYSILTTKSRVTVAQGGTGAGNAADARANLGVQSGAIAAASGTTTIPANGYLELSVTFDPAFSAVPNVVVGFVSDSTAGAFGECSCAAYDIKKTGFRIRAFNNGSSNRVPGFQWIAVGSP